jgi:hypothetical protein
MTVPGARAAGHCVEFHLLVRIEDRPHFAPPACHELVHLGVFLFARERTVPHDRPHGWRAALHDRGDLTALLRRQAKRSLKMFHSFLCAMPPSVRLSGRSRCASSDRRWWWLGRGCIIGRAEHRPGGDGKAGRDHYNSERWFHELFLSF